MEGKITEQLFNLKKDPKEMANLADAMPQKAAAYKEMLIQRLKEQQDFCNIDTPLWWKDGHKITWDELKMCIRDRLSASLQTTGI